MYKDLEYEKLANEVSQKYNWNLDEVDGSIVFWIPWNETGAFTSLEDANENSNNINKEGEVIWAYSLEDLKKLLL